MGKRFSFSKVILNIDEIALSHTDTENSVRHYYGSPSIEQLDPKFVGYSPVEIARERNQRLADLDTNSAFNVLAAVEASFQIDYRIRCYSKMKDDLSRHFRKLQKAKENRKPNRNRASLEEDILEGWKLIVPSSGALVSNLIGALRYRHWLAHGRYWLPKFGRNYDFTSVYLLAQEIYRALPLKQREHLI